MAEKERMLTNILFWPLNHDANAKLPWLLKHRIKVRFTSFQSNFAFVAKVVIHYNLLAEAFYADISVFVAAKIIYVLSLYQILDRVYL